VRRKRYKAPLACSIARAIAQLRRPRVDLSRAAPVQVGEGETPQVGLEKIGGCPSPKVSKLVSVFVCGVQKGGTTSLHAHFREHPALSPPNRQEIHFFDDEAVDWAVPNYAGLDACFAPDDAERLRFDVTPRYVYWPPSIARIRDYNLGAKLIFLFRDPFERAWSHWCMEYARGTTKLPFAEAIREGRSRRGGFPPLAPEPTRFIERGFYAEQVRRVLAHFPREQLLFLRSQDLLDDHVATLARIASFLGVAPFPDTGPKRERMRPAVSYPSVPTEADKELAVSLFRGDVREFSALTGLKVSDWQTMR
jgi:hypothetical protein